MNVFFFVRRHRPSVRRGDRFFRVPCFKTSFAGINLKATELLPLLRTEIDALQVKAV